MQTTSLVARMPLSIQPSVTWTLARQARCLLPGPGYMACRGYRPEKMEEIKRDSLEERKSLSRRVYDRLGFHPPYIDKSENFKLSFEVNPKKKPIEEDPLYQEKAALLFTHYRRLQDGLSQTLWLTKSVLMEDKMPQSVTDVAANIEIPDMERRVTETIRQSRQFDTRERVISRRRYIYTQVLALLRLSNMLGPEVALSRMVTENPLVVAAWDREDDHIQVQGDPRGILVSSRTPLPVAAGSALVEETKEVGLPTFDPLHPTIDLKSSHIYVPYENSSGFVSPNAFPHAHTRIIFNRLKWKEHHSISQTVMYTFADGFSRAKEIYGADFNSELETPIVVQGIETDGVTFNFITVQVNTLDMRPNEGVKNMVWVDQGDNQLYNDMYPQDMKLYNRKYNKNNRKMWRLFVKKRDPEVGCQDLNIKIFQKFLAFIANEG